MSIEKTNLSRRRTLLGGAGLLAAPYVMRHASLPVQAAAPMLGASRPNHHRFKLGEFEVTTLFDGAVQLPGPHPIFGNDQEAAPVQELAKANLLPGDRMEIGFAPVLVNTGKEVVLFDTGNASGRRGTGGTVTALKSAGYQPEQVDIVAMTHFHPDHVGGMIADGAAIYPNARYVANPQEFDFWVKKAPASGRTERGVKATAANVKPLAEKFTFLNDGEDVVSGITSMTAAGHTPGHTIYHLESNGKRLVLSGDFCNHYVVSLQRPDWHVVFDLDKEMAAATRRKVLGMLAAEKIPFGGYHMPFPAVGYVETHGSSFRYVPASYQLYL